MAMSQLAHHITKSCIYCQGMLCTIPPILLSCLARSLNVCHPIGLCVSALLYHAINSPVVLAQTHRVGYVVDDCYRIVVNNDNIRFAFLSNCRRTGLSLFVVTSPHWLPIHVTLVDPPSVARRSPIQAALIRSSVCSVRISHVRVIWQYALSPAIHGHHRNNFFFTNPTLSSMFLDGDRALMWFRLSENMYLTNSSIQT